MSKTTPKSIWIITDEAVEIEEGKGGTDIGADYGEPTLDNQSSRKRSRIDAEDLKPI
jgi:hypothetical protein